MEKNKPWERQNGETPKAFESFRIYRDLGPNRTIAEAEKIAKSSGNGGKGTLRQWSIRWGWIDRAAKWDDYLDEQRRKESANEILKMNRRHIEEAKALQEKALQRLQTLRMEDMSAGDTLRFFSEAVKIERTAMGVPDKVSQHEITGAGGGPIRVEQTPEKIAQVLMILSEAGVIPQIEESVIDAEFSQINDEQEIRAIPQAD